MEFTAQGLPPQDWYVDELMRSLDLICPWIQFWQAPLYDAIKVLTRHQELDVTID